MTILLPKEVMRAILWEGEGEIVRDTIIGNGRWTINHELIFRYNDKLYMAYYDVGSTEMQDESPWEYDAEVKCYEMEEVLVTKTEYRKVVT
jgi:hypothetical protein